MRKFLKALYKALPLKAPLFRFIKRFWTPPHSVYKHLSFTGVIDVKVAPGASFRMHHYGFELENEVFWKGLKGWERVSIDLWIRLSKTSRVVLDIGANTGVFALITRTVNLDAQVFAFEPVKRVYEKLQQNIRLNNYKITAVEKAVSGSDGEAVIYDNADDHIYSVTVNKNMFDAGTNVVETKIQTISLDSFIRENSLENIDLLKIDVETHEPEVLQGFAHYLARFKPTMLIEILNDEVGEQVTRLVDGMGYLFFNIDENKGIRQMERITRSDYYNYLLCSEDKAKELGII